MSCRYRHVATLRELNLVRSRLRTSSYRLQHLHWGHKKRPVLAFPTGIYLYENRYGGGWDFDVLV